MKKYFLSTNKVFEYNGIKGIDYSDSINMFDSFSECMNEAYDDLLIYINGIEEMMSIKEYITKDFLSKPEINFKMSDTIVTCEITKSDNNLTFELLQRLKVDGQTCQISLKYQFVVSEIEEENIGYVLVGRFDSDSCGYNQRLGDNIFDTIFQVFEEVEKINGMNMKNLCGCIISVVDKQYVEKNGIDKYEKQKRPIIF